MIVYLLTDEQKELLENVKYAENSYFNPVKNSDNNWVISDLEVNDCNNNDLEWVKYLPKIEYKENIFYDFKFGKGGQFDYFLASSLLVVKSKTEKSCVLHFLSPLGR